MVPGSPPSRLKRADHESVVCPPPEERPPAPNREFLGPDTPPPTGLRGDGEPDLMEARERHGLLRGAECTSPGHLEAMHASVCRPTRGEFINTLTRIEDTVRVPWRHCCQLVITDALGRRFGGSGFLVGTRTVITAGHNVFQQDIREWAASIKVAVARNGMTTPYGVQTVDRGIYTTRGWIQAGNVEADYAAIILPEALTAGSFGVADYSDADLERLWITVAGYPILQQANDTLWADSSTIYHVFSQQLTYDPETRAGMSGGCVFVTVGQDRFAVGIHNYISTSGFSVATRINREVMATIHEWRQKAGEA